MSTTNTGGTVEGNEDTGGAIEKILYQRYDYNCLWSILYMFYFIRKTSNRKNCT